MLEVLLNRPRAGPLRKRFSKEPLDAPHLIDLEVLQTLRRYWLAGSLDERDANEAVRQYLDFTITRYPHELFVSRVWELRFNFTAYDASYVALSEALRTTLITVDDRLAKAAARFIDVDAP